MMLRKVNSACLVLLLAVLIAGGSAFGAEVTQEWASRFGSYYWHDPRDLDVDSDGNVWVAGTSSGYGMYLQKYNPSGQSLLTTGYSEGGGGAVSVKVMDGVYMLGVVGCGRNYGEICRLALIKYDKAGNRVWIKKQEEPSISYQPYNILLDGQENIYVAAGDNEGRTTSTPSRLILSKYDKDGNLLWQNQYSFKPTFGVPRGIRMDKNGNIYAMIKSSVRYDNMYSYIQFEVLKYDQNGNRAWIVQTPEQREASPINDFDFGIDDDGYLFVGSYYSSVSTATVIYKYDPNGYLLWTKLKSYAFKDLYVAPDGRLGVLSEWQWTMYVSGAHGDGNYLWTNAYGIRAGSTTGDIKGGRYASGSSGNNVYILKYDEAGNFKWAQTFAIGSSTDATSRSLVVLKNGDIYATGHGSYGGMVAKFTQSGFNQPPAADAGPDQTAACAGDGADVTLDGSRSTDPDADTLTYEWTGPFGSTSGVNPVVHLPLGVHTITLTVSDGNGGTSQDTVIVTVADLQAPTTGTSVSGVAGTNGWYTSDVLISLFSTDNCAGVKEVHFRIDAAETVVPGSEAALTLNREGIFNLAYWAVDNAAQTEPTNNLEVRIDKTKPAIHPGVKPAPNADGWNNTDVLVTFACSDALSGVANCTDGVTVASEGANLAVQGAAADMAGNSASAGVTLNIDKTVPAITATVTPAPNEYGWNNSDVTITFTCLDALSGIAACPAPVTVTTEGANQAVTRTAQDRAGNVASVTVSLSIDKTPPVINLSANPGLLWPPNHKMVDVLVSGGSADVSSGTASVIFTVVDEYGSHPAVNGFNTTVPLEAWREGTDMDGRHYAITAVVTDKAGNRSTALTNVLVPHDMGK